MTRRLSRIAPWQAGRLFAVIYFFLSLLIAIPMALVSAFAPLPAAPGPHAGLVVIILFPFMYALAGFLLVPLACWIYNTAAKFVGGLEITVTGDADA